MFLHVSTLAKVWIRIELQLELEVGIELQLEHSDSLCFAPSVISSLDRFYLEGDDVFYCLHNQMSLD